MIQGDVGPATFLSAEEILQRQYVAHIVDRFARDPQRNLPKMPGGPRGSRSGQLAHHADQTAAVEDRTVPMDSSPSSAMTTSARFGCRAAELGQRTTRRRAQRA